VGSNAPTDKGGFMRRFARFFAISALLIAASPSTAQPIESMDGAGDAILACWNPPPDSTGSYVTLSFSFKRDGTLIGPPQPTELKVAGGPEAEERFIDAAIAALENCTPLEFSPTLAAGIPGQVFTMRFTSPPEETAPKAQEN
jgi:hypothetical protein